MRQKVLKNFTLLKVQTAFSPVGDIFGEARPNEGMGNQSLGRMDTRAGNWREKTEYRKPNPGHHTQFTVYHSKDGVLLFTQFNVTRIYPVIVTLSWKLKKFMKP